ncbi:MAG: DNA polymerase IV [Actinomycetaceae bacterium]|nr:DNA polymerase IV [Actinomycetaceae bacterium]MDY5853918.1 DNA polymerase IV [Arcanobacterium sp.]
MSRAPRSQAAKRDWGSDDSATPILHVDMDAFFVSVELLRRPHLRGIPLAVGGQERGVISAASYEARAFGVNSAMPVAQAKRLCPQLVILPVDGQRYHDVSLRIMNFLRSITPLVEQLSVDEAFLDVSGVRKLFGSPIVIGQMIRREIRAREGVPASVGIASTKHLAKIASTQAKPDGLLLVPESASLAFLHSLPIGALWGVGEKTRAILERRGASTVGDIAALGEKTLIRMLGAAAGSRLFALCMNRDERVVVPQREEKSMSKERTFFDPLLDRSSVEAVILEQAHDLGQRLRAHGMRAANVSLKIRSVGFATISRSATLSVATDRNADIFSAAQRLFAAAPFPDGGVRLVGVRVAALVPHEAGVQLSFGDDGRREVMDHTLDAVRERFGRSALVAGRLLKPQG